MLYNKTQIIYSSACTDVKRLKIVFDFLFQIGTRLRRLQAVLGSSEYLWRSSWLSSTCLSINANLMEKLPLGRPLFVWWQVCFSTILSFFYLLTSFDKDCSVMINFLDLDVSVLIARIKWWDLPVCAYYILMEKFLYSITIFLVSIHISNSEF